MGIRKVNFKCLAQISHQPPDLASSAAGFAEGMQRYHALVYRLVTALSNRPTTNHKLESPGLDFYMAASKAWLDDFSKESAKSDRTANRFLDGNGKQLFQRPAKIHGIPGNAPRYRIT